MPDRHHNFLGVMATKWSGLLLLFLYTDDTTVASNLLTICPSDRLVRQAGCLLLCGGERN